MNFQRYKDLNSLEEFSFIAGTPQELTYNAYNAAQGNEPLDITSGSVKLVLCPYGQPDYVALEKTGEITDISQFKVILTTDDTKLLSGLYVQQPIIVDFSGEEHRLAQGNLLIFPRIASS